MKQLIIFVLLATTSCSSKNTNDKSAINFENWIKSHDYNFDEFIVMKFNSCSDCHNQMVKFIQNGYMELMGEKAIVLIIRDNSELNPIKDHIGNSNLLVYNLQTEQQSILDYKPRIYKFVDGELEYDVIDAELLKLKIEKLIYTVTTNIRVNIYIDKVFGVPIPGNERFIARTDSSNYSYYIVNFELYNENQ